MAEKHPAERSLAHDSLAVDVPAEVARTVPSGNSGEDAAEFDSSDIVGHFDTAEDCCSSADCNPVRCRCRVEGLDSRFVVGYQVGCFQPFVYSYQEILR